MGRLYIYLILVFSLMPIESSGQGLKPSNTPVENFASLKKSSLGFSRLLDPAKMSMSHNYSMAFGPSRNGGSAMSLYTNTLAYQISPDMSFRINLGVQSVLMHTGNPSIGGNGQTRVIPGFDFTYRPRDNMFIHISYGTQSTSAYGSSYQTSHPRWAEPSSSAHTPSEYRDLRF